MWRETRQRWHRQYCQTGTTFVQSRSLPLNLRCALRRLKEVVQEEVDVNICLWDEEDTADECPPLHRFAVVFSAIERSYLALPNADAPALNAIIVSQP